MFVLENQPITMLVYWLKKSRAIVDATIGQARGECSDDDLAAALEPFNAIFAALMDAETNSASDVECQMQAVVSYLDWFKCDVIEEAITETQFRKIAANLKRATAMRQPKKYPGKLARGRKLTRAGLLFRYQSFLIEEIHTLSYEMYGDPRYALQFITFDDAVHKALKQSYRGRRAFPFLDPRTLRGRADTVLKSLKVDRVNADVRGQRATRNGGSR